MIHAIEHPAVCQERDLEHRCLLDPGHRYPTARRDDPAAPVVHVCVCWHRWADDTPTPLPSPADTPPRETVHLEDRVSLARDAGSSPTPTRARPQTLTRPTSTTEDRT